MSKRVPAAGNVQRGLFYLDKGDVRGLFSLSLPPQLHISHFQAPKRAGGTRKQSGVKGLGSQKPREDLAFPPPPSFFYCYTGFSLELHKQRWF